MSTHFDNPKTFDSSRLLREWIVPIVLIIAAMFGVRWAVVTDLNLLAAVASLVAGLALGTAVVSPRTGLYLLVFATGYLDYFKRFTVVMGMVSLQDIAVILAIAPLIFVCIVAGLISHAIFRRITIRPLDRRTIGVIVGIMSAGLLVIFRDTKSAEETLKAGANSIGYVPMLVVVGLVFQTPAETARFLRHSLCILLPVALYAIWQQFNGPTQVEYEYLKTGLTMTEGLLLDTRFRPFSTMSSPHPAAICCAMFYILCLIPKRDQKKSGFFPWLTWRWNLMGATYFLGCIATFARTGWVCAIAGVTAFYCFQSKLLTKLIYGTSIIGLALLIWNAEWVEIHLVDVEAYLPMNTALGEQAFRLGTLGDRLNGWQNILQTSGFLRPFGISQEERDQTVFVHDQIGSILVNYGYAGLLAAFALLGWALVKAHTTIWRQKDEEAQRLAIVCLSAIFGVLLTGALFGSNTSIFPINVYFWFVGGALLQALVYQANPSSGSLPIAIDPLRREPRSRPPSLDTSPVAEPTRPLTPRR